ncbi:uncharacterized protein [Miscanthus floridulus]|uniref:uncharacterized protein isoform X8 n=1 Tax=Miscanthus floridulus TaxID=154761 RepID=UPI0034577668
MELCKFRNSNYARSSRRRTTAQLNICLVRIFIALPSCSCGCWLDGFSATRRDKWCCLLCKLFFSSASNQMSLISCCPFVTLLHDYLALIISGFLKNLEHLDWHYSDSHYIVWGHTHG